MLVVISHILLGIILFLIINWIGKHSYSIGYMEISLFVETEEAPALNFAIRVLTPIVFIIVVSSVLYYFGLDRFVKNIFLVNLYYIVFRLLFNLATNRGLLLNWYRQFLYWFAIIIISYFVYEKLISVKKNILPDFTTIANELWIIILVFLFQVANNIRLSQEGTFKRKIGYLESRLTKFQSLYGTIIKPITQNQHLEAVVYAILIYEDFNRPKVIRFIENAKQYFTKKPHTTGVMQVRSDTILSDEQSVKIGTNKILDAYKKYLTDIKDKPNYYSEYNAYYAIISDYNGGNRYMYEVADLASIIKENFYKETIDSLNPNSDKEEMSGVEISK